MLAIQKAREPPTLRKEQVKLKKKSMKLWSELKLSWSSTIFVALDRGKVTLGN